MARWRMSGCLKIFRGQWLLRPRLPGMPGQRCSKRMIIVVLIFKKNHHHHHAKQIFRIFPKQVIAAEGEHKASRALRHAAEVIIDSPAALQVFQSAIPVKEFCTHLDQSQIAVNFPVKVKMFFPSCATCKPWTASRRRTTAPSSSQCPSTSYRRW